MNHFNRHFSLFLAFIITCNGNGAEDLAKQLKMEKRLSSQKQHPASKKSSAPSTVVETLTKPKESPESKPKADDYDIVEVVPKKQEPSKTLPTPKKPTFTGFQFAVPSKESATETPKYKQKSEQISATPKDVAKTKREKSSVEIQLDEESKKASSLKLQEQELRAKKPIEYLKLQQNLAAQAQTNKKQMTLLIQRMKFLESMESEYGKNMILGNRRTMTDDIVKNNKKVIESLKSGNYENLSRTLRARIRFLDGAIADAREKKASGLTGVTTESLEIYEREREIFLETLKKTALLADATKTGDVDTVKDLTAQIEDTFGKRVDEIETMNKTIAAELFRVKKEIQSVQAAESAALKVKKADLDKTETTLQEKQKRALLMTKSVKQIKAQTKELKKRLKNAKAKAQKLQSQQEYRDAKKASEDLADKINVQLEMVSNLSEKMMSLKIEGPEKDELKGQFDDNVAKLETLRMNLKKANSTISKSEQAAAIEFFEKEIKLHESVLKEKMESLKG